MGNDDGNGYTACYKEGHELASVRLDKGLITPKYVEVLLLKELVYHTLLYLESRHLLLKRTTFLSSNHVYIGCSSANHQMLRNSDTRLSSVRFFQITSSSVLSLLGHP